MNNQGQSHGSDEGQANRRKVIIFAAIGAIIVLAVIIVAVYFLLTASPSVTAQIRDVFIIFMALESLLVGLVLVLLVIQLARLTNLLQNEIKPILESTNETISTLRGTTEFLSDNVVQPVIKMNEYMAAIQQLLWLVGLGRKNGKSKTKT